MKRVKLILPMYTYKVYIGLVASKADFVACEQPMRRSACASAQSDQSLCYSLPGKKNSYPYYMRNLNFLASLCSLGGWFESFKVANP